MSYEINCLYICPGLFDNFVTVQQQYSAAVWDGLMVCSGHSVSHNTDHLQVQLWTCVSILCSKCKWGEQINNNWVGGTYSTYGWLELTEDFGVES